VPSQVVDTVVKSVHLEKYTYGRLTVSAEGSAITSPTRALKGSISPADEG
jgi:hypothetical protein